MVKSDLSQMIAGSSRQLLPALLYLLHPCSRMQAITLTAPVPEDGILVAELGLSEEGLLQRQPLHISVVAGARFGLDPHLYLIESEQAA